MKYWANGIIIIVFILLSGFQFPKQTEYKLPTLKLDHLKRLTDKTGIFEFANGTDPLIDNGYCIEDVARALVAVYMYESVTGHDENITKSIYWNYIKTSRISDGRFHHRSVTNYKLSKNIDKSKRIAKGDAYGRLLWGLGCAIAYEKSEHIVQEATDFFDRSLDYLTDFTIPHPRATAYAVQGLYYYLKKYPENITARKYLHQLCIFLCDQYNKNSEENWNWFQNSATYDNCRIPLALFLAYEITGEWKYFEIAKKSLEFLIKHNFHKNSGYLSVIGNNGWLQKGKKAAEFDQQPIDAAAMVEVCAKAYEILQDERYRNFTVTSFEWFLGNNALNDRLYDDKSGGCRDGLTKNGANANQGAESTIMYIIARCTMENYKD